jgi:peptide/nickel transport system substrate-binding protein
MWVILGLLLIAHASAETRPRYGGTLRVEMRAAPPSLDPAVPAIGDDPGFAQIAPLVYDTLIRLDSSRRPMPSLASSWQQEGERRWRFTLRAGVRFPDATGLTSAVVAQSLHESNPDWNVRPLSESIIIESEQPLPDLPAALALPRNSIVLRSDSKILGTGPFRVNEFQPGRRLMLAAVEEGWHERPFVDAIDIQFNRGAREQAMDLELGRADIVEVAPDQLARLSQSGRRVFTSDPVDLLALRFSHSNLRDGRVREAIALTVDRDSIFNVLLQRHGEPTAGLLPNWITGYSFLFATAPQVARARQLRVEAKQTAALTLVYDAADPLARLVAERVALNANDAGITLKTLPSTQNVIVPDVELVRVRLASTDPAVALAEVSRTDCLALPVPDAGAPPLSAPGAGADRVGDTYRATVVALQDHWAVPIAYLPAASAASPRVRNWTRTRDGSWQIENVWLAAEAR